MLERLCHEIYTVNRLTRSFCHDHIRANVPYFGHVCRGNHERYLYILLYGVTNHMVDLTKSCWIVASIKDDCSDYAITLYKVENRQYWETHCFIVYDMGSAST